LLLTNLPSQGLVLEVPQLQLIENAPDLDPQRRFLVMTIESICYRDYTHSSKMQLSQDREHEVIVASQARKIIHQDHLELPHLCGIKQHGQALAIFAGS
jgi:outer membrane lipopolysaccharide assembly protein LptE/RlpB